MEKVLKTIEETISEIIDNQAKIVHQIKTTTSIIKALNTRLEQLEKVSPIIPVTEINDEVSVTAEQYTMQK
tara:strand:+ start:1457 stop:1669 length:213 start_codon:yes stop_codon:yes gene_type:complete